MCRYGGAYFGRAQVFHSQGKYQEALTDYQTALRIRPDMRWQIEPYMQDVQEKFIEKAAAAEAVRMDVRTDVRCGFVIFVVCSAVACGMCCAR